MLKENGGKKMEIRNASMTSEALQNLYFVRLYCKNIDKTHSLTEPNDKIQYHGNYFFKKGGEPLLKRGGGTGDRDSGNLYPIYIPV